MATAKYVGIETEYGITVTGPAEVNAVVASSMVVSAYRAASRRTVGWDHTDEQPFRDARGFESDAAQRAASADLGMTNSVLTNGARFYVDHAHPEYATPECSNPIDAVIWDKAGESILRTAAALAERELPEGCRMLIHKNNTDGKGAAYGTHENYLVPRSIPFGHLTACLLPFFVSRQVVVGAGKVGSELDPSVGFQLTQRADFFEVEVGLETTLKRPLMNTRDEPHADPDRYRRLHVINADANLCEIATLLKCGTMMVVLDAIEDGAVDDRWALTSPVAAMHRVSHDPTLRCAVDLVDGRSLTAVELQWEYYAAVAAHLERVGTQAWQRAVMDWWQIVLERAEDDPARLVGLVDWATKWELLDGYASRHGLSVTHDRVKMVDLQYHDLRHDRGLFNRLVARNRVERVTTDAQIDHAVTSPPEDTRAWFRGECIRRFPDAVVAAGWDAVVLDVGADALQRIPMMEPGRGTRALTQALFERAATAKDLLAELTKPAPEAIG